MGLIFKHIQQKLNYKLIFNITEYLKYISKAEYKEVFDGYVTA